MTILATLTINGIPVARVSAEGTFASGMPGQPTTPKGNYALLGAIAEGPEGNVSCAASIIPTYMESHLRNPAVP